jgi:hypothetical protein
MKELLGKVLDTWRKVHQQWFSQEIIRDIELISRTFRSPVTGQLIIVRIFHFSISVLIYAYH